MKRLPRAELILPLTILAGAVLLGISEFMVTFELTPPGAEPLDELTAADRHSYALLILAAFAVGSMMLAVGTGLRAFAFAAAGFGVAALLIFLIVDLPDAGKLGTLGGDSEFTFSTAEAVPQTGFLLEAVGSVVLGLATVAFATLRSDQLQAPLARFGRGREDRETDSLPEDARTKVEAQPKPERPRRLTRRASRDIEPDGAKK